MIGNGKVGRTSPWAVLTLAVAVASGLLSASSALAEKGGKKPPPPPPPPGEWEVIILQPIGDYYWSIAYGASGAQQAGFAITTTGNDYHAGLWNGTAESWVDLNPAGARDSWAYGVSDGQQVGWADVYPYRRASLWSGTAESWVNLHPAGISSSCAYGIGDGQQVGSANGHASLWTGTAESWVDLHPSDPAWISSHADGVSGGQQVGAVVGAGIHASLWSGTPASWLDLHPPRSGNISYAYGVSDGQQVGSAWIKVKGKYEVHAGMWTGTAASWVDLNPEGYDGSEAHGVSHGYQAGSAWISGEFWHAGMWSGTAESWVDLSTLLPADFGNSIAQDIEVTSTDIWVVGWANHGNTHAVLWHKRISE